MTATRLPSALSNVARLALPAPGSAHQTLPQPPGDPVLATATEAWRALHEFAWSYPRLWYALWSHLMALPPRRGPDL